MTDRTIRREFCLHMVRIGRAVIVGHVAVAAGAACQVVIIVDVALRALQVGMAIGEGESDGIVIEIRRLPGGRRVTQLASLREISGYVIGVSCFLVVRQMASHARGRGPFELVVDVASRTT